MGLLQSTGQSSSRDEHRGVTGTANRWCLPWEGGLCLAPFIFLPPFEAALSERLSQAASVTKTCPARRKKQLRGGKQIRCRGPEVLPPPMAHRGPPPLLLWRERHRRKSTHGFGMSCLGMMEDTGKSWILWEQVVVQSRAQPWPPGTRLGMLLVPCPHPQGAF